MNLENNFEESSEDVSSLNDILNTITSSNSQYLNNVNEIELINKEKKINNESQILNNKTQSSNNESQSSNNDLNEINQVKNNIELFTHEIDRKIGKYLFDRLEKNQNYIDELEEVVKFQENEIKELKLKLESINKLELVAKLKTSIEEKNNSSNKDEKIKNSEILVINKPNNKNNLNEDNSNTYYSTNPDLVLSTGSRNKVKSISKEEEELRYSGITILEKPQTQQLPKIVLDYEKNTLYNDNIENSEYSEKSEKSSEIIKQRRRGNRI
jgi:hypothetical protein